MIRTEQDDVELMLIHPVYKTKTFHRTTNDGTLEKYDKQVIIRELCVHRWFKREAIIGVQEYITSKNTIAKNRCLVLDKYSNQFFAVFHSVQEVRDAIKIKPKNKIGFNICQ
jgi:hypothetical protein